MPIKVHLPDGRTVNFPDGMPPEQIQAEVAKLSPAAPVATPERGWGETLANALPSIGGAVGGIAGNVPGALLGGAAGEGFKQLATKAGEIPGALKDIAGNLTSQPGAMAGGFLRGAASGANEAAGQSAIQGVTQGAGNAVGAGLQLVGRGLYRAGAMPILKAVEKDPNLLRKGLEARVAVTKGGLAKAQGLKAAAQGHKAAAISAADDTASLLTGTIAKNATQDLAGDATAMRRAGLPDPTLAIVKRAERFTGHNPPGLKPSEAEGIKSTLSDRLGGAYKKLRMKEPLAMTELQDMAYENELKRGLETVVPNYRGMNREVMDAEGIRRMVQRRLMGNQGLENAAAMAAIPVVGSTAAIARAAMIPQVMSSAGIAANELGKKTPNIMSNLVRAAILAQLEGEPTNGR